MELKTLSNGVKIPTIGLGVYLAEEGEQAQNAVQWALQSGYRHIDTAACYHNEQSVGEAMRKSGVPREQIFLTTKIWNTDVRARKCRQALEKSLTLLGMDYVDLYLIHWAAEGYEETWLEMEKLYQEGKIRAIGVSNFTQKHLKVLEKMGAMQPMVNQIMSNPQFADQAMVDYCNQRGIAVQAWSPLGGTGSNQLSDPLLVELGAKYGKSPAQIVIRWHLQRDVIVLPKSVHEARIQANIDVYDFSISDEDMARISALTSLVRPGSDPENFDF